MCLWFPTSQMQKFHLDADQRPDEWLLLQCHCEKQQSVSYKTTQLEQTCGFQKHTELLLTLILNQVTRNIIILKQSKFAL